MAAPTIKAGMVLRYPNTGPAHDPKRPHDCVVLTNPNAKDDILLVPICSHRPGCDETCVLNVGDGWSGIKWKSHIAYHQIFRVFAKNIRKFIESGTITIEGEMPSALFDKIRTGVEASEETTLKMQDYFASDKDC